MKIELTPEQLEFQQYIKRYTDEMIVPLAKQHDLDEKLDEGLLEKLKQDGYLGSMMSKEYGGMGLDMISLGILNEEFGRGCASVRSLLTVHGMVALALQRWGTNEQKSRFLSKLATGEWVGAFALTEPNVGSDAKNVECHVQSKAGRLVLNGKKKWITMGQMADVFLIIAQYEGKPTAFLLERTSPGFTTKPMSGFIGVRAGMIAELDFQDCQISEDQIVGSIGTGLSHVALSSLDYGRYTVAWGCIGTAQACLEDSVKYARKRKQFKKAIWEYQLIQKKITEMYVQLEATRLLCYKAGYLKDIGDPDTIMATWTAKYFASKMVNEVANHAVQIHGGNGLNNEFPVERYYRDARINEIIEGTTEMHEVLIAMTALRMH